jgi:ketosteroid isomerase-like protein
MRTFRNAIERARASGEVGCVMALLAEDVVFRSPVVYAPYQGRAAVEPLLRAVVQMFDDLRAADRRARRLRSRARVPRPHR